ncbi:hypothetical protein QCA50_016640 [Cerrena zonata]|uniref:Uncharacterized protein n=1 Tax=Cerrena zonata TaxID=2478898 RepID=A0AAW0FFN8_9APHY
MAAEDPILVIQDFLRESDEVKVAVNARTAQVESPSEVEDLRTDSSEWEDATKLRILSVVCHLDYDIGEEQGCVFIFKPRLRRVSPDSAPYTIENVLPILGPFSISMAQPRRITMDLSRATSLSPTSLLNHSKTELKVTIHPGHDTTLQPISLLTRDTHGLRAVLAECKRLKELTDANYEPEVTPPFTWILPYISNSLPEILSPIPSDLRHVHRPAYTLLSHATAGQPTDEPFDISLIREDWIKHKVYDEVFGPSQKLPLRIRIGTFNVNGKLPSQDLSPWLRGASTPPHHLPPVKQVSPLSLGEIGSRSYFEGQAEYVESASLASIETTTAGTNVTDASNYSLRMGASASQETLADTRADHGDQNDPDLFVLGFQELDLSTEALLYSTKTTREDAWCTAVLAGLGEKATGYQKAGRSFDSI